MKIQLYIQGDLRCADSIEEAEIPKYLNHYKAFAARINRPYEIYFIMSPRPHVMPAEQQRAWNKYIRVNGSFKMNKQWPSSKY